jgi:hypothetical protein
VIPRSGPLTVVASQQLEPFRRQRSPIHRLFLQEERLNTGLPSKATRWKKPPKSRFTGARNVWFLAPVSSAAPSSTGINQRSRGSKCTFSPPNAFDVPLARRLTFAVGIG